MVPISLAFIENLQELFWLIQEDRHPQVRNQLETVPIAKSPPSDIGSGFFLLAACYSIGSLPQAAAPPSLARHPVNDARIASNLEIAAH